MDLTCLVLIASEEETVDDMCVDIWFLIILHNGLQM